MTPSEQMREAAARVCRRRSETWRRSVGYYSDVVSELQDAASEIAALPIPVEPADVRERAIEVIAEFFDSDQSTTESRERAAVRVIDSLASAGLVIVPRNCD